MKQFKRILPLFMLLLLLTPSLLPTAAQAAEPETSNIVTYVPQGETEAHTIHWLRGITPPTMPGQTVRGETLTLGNADFKLIDGSGRILTPETIQDAEQNPNAEEYYVTAYLPGNGWYDVNKMNESAGPDKEMCFAVAATNLMHWWLDQNGGHVDGYLARLDAAGDPMADTLRTYRQEPASILQDPASSRIYQNVILPNYRYSGGGWPDLPMDFFFNGYPARDEAPRNTPADFEATPGGGLFYPVFGKSILTDRRSGGRYDDLNRQLKEHMDSGTGVVLGYSVLGNAAHAVALWGAEYDENDQLCAIYITDNNDTGVIVSDNRFGPNGALGADSQLISMIRYTAYNAADPAGRLKITTYKNPRNRGSMINDRFLLTLAEPGWQHYEQTGEPMYADGRAFLSPDYSQVQCDHHYVYTADHGRITRTCDKCGSSVWVEMRQREAGPFVYNGYAHKPFVMYSSLGTSYPFSPTMRYRNNCDAGTASVSLSFADVSTTLTFEIEKASQTAPERPVLVEKTANTVTLQTMDGMEYRMDDGSWQQEPVFAGLQPATAYRFTMRRAEQPNYLPSEASEVLQVTTEEGAAVPQITGVGHSLSLDDIVSINEYVQITGYDPAYAEQNGGLLIWKSEPADAVFETAEIVKAGLTKTDKGYGRQTDGIAAKEYGDLLYLRTYVRNPDGTYTYGPLTSYSVRTYALTAIKQNAAVRETAIQLLHFGAAAQEKFEYKTDTLCNAGIPAGNPWKDDLLTPAAAVPDLGIVPTADVTVEGRSLSLDGKIMANFYFDTDLPVQKAELLFWSDARAEALTFPLELTQHGFGAQPCGFAADEYEQTVFVCARFTADDGSEHYSEVVPFSVEDYARRAIHSGNVRLQTVAEQLVLFGEAANAYLP